MAEVRFRPEASCDLADIHAVGVERFGESASDRYHDGLQLAVMRLATFPEIGPIYPGIRPSIRYLAYRRHHIFYDYDGKTVWIARILHHARDMRHLL